jgi:hypothetical protein
MKIKFKTSSGEQERFFLQGPRNTKDIWVANVRNGKSRKGLGAEERKAISKSSRKKRISKFISWMCCPVSYLGLGFLICNT